MAFAKVFAMVFGFMILVSCASEAEKKERRENSLDISGQYKATVDAGSQLDLQFEIKNESGRHDIVITAMRNGELTPQETQLLTRQNINPETVRNYFKNPLILGKGYSNLQLDGGENISEDLGETSQFMVCSNTLRYNQEYIVYYCMDGKISKNEKKMEGKLSLEWHRSRKVVKDGKTVDEFTSDQVDLKYRSDANQVFYKQYFGSWSGDSFSLLSGFATKQLQTLEIRESANEKYLVKFAGSINYNGESYVFQDQESLFDVAELMVSEYPAIETTYVSPSGRKLVLIAQIWSLGDLTGTLVQVDGSNLYEIATIRLKKD